MPWAFLLAAIFCLTPWATPPLALALGMASALLFGNPYASRLKNATKYLLQASVVGLGFGLDLQHVLKAGQDGFLYTAAGIAFTMAAGYALGRLLGVPPTTSYLISTGTAICGGSAIAAVGPILEAKEEEMFASLATVYVLNGIGLFVFPAIGTAYGLTQEQFGLWAALAIHDTSSVVGATVRYGAVALAVGTTVKLARALWIIPVSVATALFRASKVQVQWPWFILFFCLASAISTYLPAGREIYESLNALARKGLTVTLFLIGGGVSMATLKAVGPKPFLQGVLLWLLAAAVSLFLITHL